MKKRICAAALAAVLLLTLTGCSATPLKSGQSGSQDLTIGLKALAVSDTALRSSRSAAAKYSVELFKSCAGENVLLSPLSVLCALAMTANGAEGETLSQMESVLGMSKDQLNLFVHTYMSGLPEAEQYKLSLANSIWFRDSEDFAVNQDFLQANTDYFDASIYKAPFDQTTLEDINRWVSDKTDGMIDSILDDIPVQSVMYMINALSFDAEWEDIYLEEQIRDGVFTTERGSQRNIKLMYHTENTYLEDELATGFIKYYADKKYAFVAMLPNEGVSLSDYVASLDGEALLATLDGAAAREVLTSIPKFECEYSVTLNDCLASMGMTNAFDQELADFAPITRGMNELYISRVLHKTFISVDRQGTRAGAVTSVEMRETGIMIPDEEIKTVYLDRPFVYMLIDCESELPLFIGTMDDVLR